MICLIIGIAILMAVGMPYADSKLNGKSYMWNVKELYFRKDR